MVNSVLCTKCGNCVHGRCAKIKRATDKLTMHIVCWRCRVMMKETVDSIEKLCDEVKTMNYVLLFGRQTKF